ncbi:MAG: transposase [Acidimicrobiia bacterium]|nr:transposase [Acidimicrobiia bacterium]NNF42340.1 transposase [Phycisphaerales bacterium]
MVRLLAIAYGEVGTIPRARACAERAHQLRADPEMLLIVAQCDRVLGRTDQAVHSCDQILQQFPRLLPKAMIMKAAALEEGGRFADARAALSPMREIEIDLCLLIFIHVASRRVFVSPATANPGADWTEQHARNFTMHIEESGLGCTMMLHDRDTKFTRVFDHILDPKGAPKKLPPCSPNLNAFAERFVQTLKHECLTHFIVFGERHLNHLANEFVDYYHTARPHQGIGNATPIQSRDGPRSGPIRCNARLGGVLKHYSRAA